MLCNNCGKSLDGNLTLCPECAEARNQATPQRHTSATPALASNPDQQDARLPIEGSPRRGLRFHRFTAFMVDATIMGLPVALISAALQHVLLNKLLQSDPTASAASITFMVMPAIGAMLAYFAACLIVPPLYYILMEAGGWQATVGKRVLGLYVVNQHGARCSIQEAAIRYFGRTLLPFVVLLVIILLVSLCTYIFKDSSAFIPVLVALVGVFVYIIVCGKIYLSYLFSPTRQGLHDRLAKCYVVARDDHPSYGVAIAIFVFTLIISAIISALTPRPPKKQYSNSNFRFENGKLIQGTHETPRDPTSPQKENPKDIEALLVPSEEPAPARYLPENDPAATAIPTPTPTTAPTVPAPDPEVVTFGSASRVLSNSVAVMNASRTELRIYLGQKDYSPQDIAIIETGDLDESLNNPRADMTLIATFSDPVEADCSLSKASTLKVLLHRTGITGFPLPGRSLALKVTPQPDTLADKILCGPTRALKANSLGQIAITGTLRGKGVYTQGEAAWPVSWNVRVGG